jgi:hypothetical protein
MFCACDGMSPEGSDAIVNALCDPDADPARAANIFRSRLVFEVVDPRKDPNELLILLEVEWQTALNPNTPGEISIHHIAECRPHDYLRKGAIRIKLGLAKIELVLKGDRVALLLGIQVAVIEKVVYDSLPRLDACPLDLAGWDETRPRNLTQLCFQNTERSVTASSLTCKPKHFRPSVIVLGSAFSMLSAKKASCLSTELAVAQDLTPFLWRLIGIGRDLTASPLPHHRTYGSRIRRFGGFSQRWEPRWRRGNPRPSK